MCWNVKLRQLGGIVVTLCQNSLIILASLTNYIHWRASNHTLFITGIDFRVFTKLLEKRAYIIYVQFVWIQITYWSNLIPENTLNAIVVLFWYILLWKYEHPGGFQWKYINITLNAVWKRTEEGKPYTWLFVQCVLLEKDSLLLIWFYNKSYVWGKELCRSKGSVVINQMETHSSALCFAKSYLTTLTSRRHCSCY